MGEGQRVFSTRRKGSLSLQTIPRGRSRHYLVTWWAFLQIQWGLLCGNWWASGDVTSPPIESSKRAKTFNLKIHTVIKHDFKGFSPNVMNLCSSDSVGNRRKWLPIHQIGTDSDGTPWQTIHDSQLVHTLWYYRVEPSDDPHFTKNMIHFKKKWIRPRPVREKNESYPGRSIDPPAR